MRISDWSSDVCSSDLHDAPARGNQVRDCRAAQIDAEIPTAECGAAPQPQPLAIPRLLVDDDDALPARHRGEQRRREAADSHGDADARMLLGEPHAQDRRYPRVADSGRGYAGPARKRAVWRKTVAVRVATVG